MTTNSSDLYLGSWRAMGSSTDAPVRLPSKHLVTHGVIVGMTGSGKTGLVTVMVEESLRAKIPVLIVDVKGDLPNLLLSFPEVRAEDLKPWIDIPQGEDPDLFAEKVAREREQELRSWSIGPKELKEFCDSTAFRVITPGSSAGELLHVLSSLERSSSRWQEDLESARDSLSAAISLVLRLLERDSDPTKSKEHVFLSVLAERRLLDGKPADLPSLLEDINLPPVEKIGALDLDDFFSKSERKSLAASINALLASPTFGTWRQGASLNIEEWLTPQNGRTPCVIVSVAHLDDQERSLVLGVLLQEVLSWVRGLSGSSQLKALLLFDEIYGFLPPYPANPPTKRPLVALMKQARAFGLGVVIATQNPMDLDYRALGNAGFWALGRLQTDADCDRVLESLSAEQDTNQKELGKTVRRLLPRWFVVRDLHAKVGNVLVKARTTMSLLRGPMTRAEIRKAIEMKKKQMGENDPEPDLGGGI